ncbi:MAG: protein kinase [Acidobacteria bacterium]|nr:protein kinase [Acidobacteriota bacterium]
MAAGVIGPYRVLSSLGSGGMGEVCLAEDTRLGRRVAIKTLLVGDAMDDHHAELLAEARAAARLSHRHIAAVYDVLEWDGRLHLVMEYVEGVPLSQRLGPQALPTRDFLTLAAAICDAVGHAHAHGVVHCDLKPANVIIQRDGTPKVLDFGLARIIDSMTRTSASIHAASPSPRPPAPAVRGTLAYMAPEVLAGRSPDERADIFSLGVILYEMATGTRPFPSADRLEHVLQVMGAAPVPPSARRPDGGPELDRLILGALSRRPEHRPATATSLAENLAELASQTAPTTTPAWPGRRAAGAWIRPAGVLLVAATCLAVLAVPVGQRYFGSGGAGRGEAALGLPVVLVAASTAEARPNDAMSTGLAGLLAARLAGTPGLVVVAPQGGAAGSVAMQAAEQGASHVLEPTVQRLDAQTVQLGVRLQRVSDGAVMWGEVVTGSPLDVATLQRQLGDAASAALAQHGLAAQASASSAPDPASPQSVGSFEAFEEYSQGRVLLQRPDVPGNLERATTLFERSIAREPTFALAHAALGRAHWSLFSSTRDPVWAERARLSALEALRLAPGVPEVRILVAQIYHGSGRTEAAVEELNAVLATSPSIDDAHRLLGRILCDGGHTAQGLGHLDQARRLRAGYWDTYRALGLCHFRAGQFEAAIEAFTRLTELQPDSAWGFQTLGTAHHAVGHLDEALANYREALARAPNARAWSNIGTVHYQRGEFADAVTAYQHALALRPNEPLTHRNLGDAYWRLDRRQDARAAFERAGDLARRALAVNPNDAAALALQAFCAARLGNADDADVLSARAVSLAPRDKDVWYERVVVLALANRTTEAVDALRQAVEHGYSWSWIEQDADLAAVRQLPQYAELRAGHGQ